LLQPGTFALFRSAWNAISEFIDSFEEDWDAITLALGLDSESHSISGIFDAKSDHPEWRPVAAALEPFNLALAAWQARYKLKDDWIRSAAQETIWSASGTFGYPNPSHELLDYLPNGLPLMLDGSDLAAGPHVDKLAYARVHGIRPGTIKWGPAHKQVRIPVYLDDLKHPPVPLDGGELEDDGEFGTYDPRMEDIEYATERLLDALRPRIRARLEAIEAEDRELNHAVPPVAYRSDAAFEWLVLYQVCGESMRAIARADMKDAGHVSREIHRAADLIGLTLRPPERRGRPRKTHARTVKVLR
jgi:hypothetical protein